MNTTPRLAAAALTALVLSLAAPAHGAVSRCQYDAAAAGEVKHDVQAAFGSKGVRTLTWSDRGAWIQKSYRGVRIPDRWTGTETKAVVDYLWVPGTGWVLEYKTWCVWDNLSSWDCA